MAEAKKENKTWEEIYREKVNQIREWSVKPDNWFVRLAPYILVTVLSALIARLWWYKLTYPGRCLDIDDIFVEGIEGSLVINILLIIGCLYSTVLLLLYTYFNKPRYWHLPIYAITAVFICVIPKWHPVETAIPGLYYSGFIAICLVSILLGELLSLILGYITRDKLITLGSGEHGFVTKTEEKEMVDTGWEDYINTIFDLVGEKQLAEESFAIGIAGSWGSGKTTFYNAIKSKIKDDHRFVLCEFKPWQILEPGRIAPEFFAILAEALQNSEDGKHTHLLDDLKKYAQLLTEVPELPDYAKLFTSIVGANENKSVSAMRDQIDKHLKNSYIIVLIDDLDRLNKEELLEIMRLVRASANFKHVLFILTYDKGYFKRLLDDENGLEYLKKIVNVEISLPPIERYKYGHLLLQSIGNICDTTFETADQNKKAKTALFHLEKLVKDENARAEESVLYEHLYNFRDIKRFSNQFGLALRHLIKLNEIDNYSIKDLFWLEVLHYVDEDTYTDLRKNHNILLEFKTSRSIKQRTLTIRQNIDISKKKSYTILKELFVSSEEYKHTPSIVWINNYYSYFTYRQVDNYISATEFVSIMQEPNPNKIVNKIKHLLKNSYNKNNITQILKDYPQRGRFDNETAANNYIFLLSSLLFMTKPYVLEDFVIALIKEKCLRKRFSKIANYTPEEIICSQIEGHPDLLWNRFLTAMCDPIDTSISEMDIAYRKQQEDTAYILSVEQLQKLAIHNYTQLFKGKKMTAWELFNRENEHMRFISGLSYPSKVNRMTNAINAYGNLIGQYILEQQIKGRRRKKYRKETFDTIYQNLMVYSKAREYDDEESAKQAIYTSIEQIIGSVPAFEKFLSNYFEFDESDLIICKNLGLNIQQPELNMGKGSTKQKKRVRLRKMTTTQTNIK